MTFEEMLEGLLQDDEFALLYAEEDRKVCEMCRRLCSRLKIFWKLYYRFMPAKFTGM